MHNNQPCMGPGAFHTTTTQTANLASSLLNTPINTNAAQNESPLTDRKARENTHPCTWPGCTRFFAGPWNVAQHIREKHTFEKPYKCVECAADGVNTAFSRQYGLNRHMVQVHPDVKKSSNVAVRHPAAATGPQPTQAGAAGEYGEMVNMLTSANAQFPFDAQQSNTVSEQQSSFNSACGECDFAADSEVDVLMHMHGAHQIPYSPFCSCNICKMFFVASLEDGTKHSQTLCNGGLIQAQAQENDFDNDATAMQFEPQGGNYDGNIDPALLFSGAEDATSHSNG